MRFGFVSSLRRRAIRAIRSETKKRVKIFLALQSIDETTKVELLRSFRRRTIWFSEANELSKQTHAVLRPFVLLSALSAMMVGPIIFWQRSPSLGFILGPTLDDLLDQPLGAKLKTFAGFIVAVLPLFIVAVIFLIAPRRLRRSMFLPLFNLTLALSFVVWLVILSNIVISARSHALGAGQQLFAIALVALCSYMAVLIIAASSASAITNRVQTRMMKTLPDSFIIAGLTDALESVENYSVAWPETDFKRLLIVEIETVAVCMERYLPNRLRAGNAGTDNWVQDSSEQIAEGMRSLIRWVYTPKADTRGQLIAKLAYVLVHSIRGDWDVLERVERKAASRRALLKLRIGSLLTSLLFAGIPILLVHLIIRLNIIDIAVTKPILIGAYLWAAVTVLSQLDPLYGAKLGTIKDLAQWLPFSKTNEKS